MTRTALAGLLGAFGMGAIAATAVAHPSERADQPLFAECRAVLGDTELCPCIVTEARGAGVLDAELRTIFANEAEFAASAATSVSGSVQGVNRVQYNRFRRARMHCVRQSAMAQMGGGPDAPATGVQSDGSYSARPIPPQPLPADQYIGQAPQTGTPH